MFILLCHSVRVKSEVGWYGIPQDNFFPSLSVMNPQQTDLSDEYSQSPLLSGFWPGLANGQHQQAIRGYKERGWGIYSPLSTQPCCAEPCCIPTATSPVGPSRVIPGLQPLTPTCRPFCLRQQDFLVLTIPEYFSTPCPFPKHAHALFTKLYSAKPFWARHLFPAKTLMIYIESKTIVYLIPP